LTSPYYIDQKLAGQPVALQVRASDRMLVAHHRQRVVKQLPLKALHGGPLPFADYVAMIRQEARSHQYIGMRRVRQRRDAA
jgi:hypothetical protein